MIKTDALKHYWESNAHSGTLAIMQKVGMRQKVFDEVYYHIDLAIMRNCKSLNMSSYYDALLAVKNYFNGPLGFADAEKAVYHARFVVGANLSRDDAEYYLPAAISHLLDWVRFRCGSRPNCSAADAIGNTCMADVVGAGVGIRSVHFNNNRAMATVAAGRGIRNRAPWDQIEDAIIKQMYGTP